VKSFRMPAVNNFAALSLSLFVLNGAPSAVGEDISPPEVLFGSTLTLAGGGAQFSEACRNAIELASSEVNSGGGINGAKLRVLIEDFGDLDLKRAVSAAHKLINVDRVSAILPNWSEDTEVIAPIADRAGIVAMTLGAGGPGAARYAPSLFRATTSDGELATAAARDYRAQGATRACVLHANTNYFQDIGRSLVETWLSSGGEVTFHEEIDYNEHNMSSLVTRLNKRGCDVVFVWTSPAQIGKSIRELRRQRVSAPRVLPWFADTPDVLNETKGDISSVELYRWVIKDMSFLERYKARFGVDARRPAGNCYDGVMRLASAARKVGTARDKLMQELLAGEDFSGVTGPFKVLPSRERTGEVYERVRIVDGKVS
jgi:branched-chain amino acid transport system substrate-binding protein